MRFYIALWFSKLLNFIINIIDDTKGSNFSGEKALKIDPLFISHFKSIDLSKVIFITGTNGKSTTNNLTNHIVKKNGYKVVSNLEGANLISGIATALLKASTLDGRVISDFYIFETDERFLPLIHEQLPAENLLITNLQKDQIQRNGDPDFIYRKIKKFLINNKLRLFINNDEPRSKALEEYAGEIIRYGVVKHSKAFNKDDTYVTMPCPRCFHSIEVDYYNNDGMGRFKCSNCDHMSSDSPDYLITDVDFDNNSFKFMDVTFHMPYPVPYMLYDYSAALTIANNLCNISPIEATSALMDFKNIGGRYEILNYKDKTIKYMRIKQENPETLQNSLNVIADDPNPKMIALGLCPLVDMIPHYAVSFYAFDCDFSKLVNDSAEKYFCFSEAVCFDTANRLIYEGVDPDKITIENSENLDKIFEEINSVKTDNIYIITWLSTYEAMNKYLKKEGA